MSLPQSNRPFDTRLWAVRSRPLSSDNNQQAGNDSLTLRELLRYALSWRGVTSSANGIAAVPTGFISDAFKIDGSAGLAVSLRQGLGFMDGTGDAPTNINGNLNANDLSPEKPLVLTTPETISVPSADPSNPRWDIVVAQYDRQINNPQSRGILNTTTGVFDPTLIALDESFTLDGTSTVNGGGPINYITGSPAGSPVIPSTPSGFTRLGRVYVPAGATALTSDLIIDDRRLLQPGGIIRISGGCDIDHSTYDISNAWVDAPPGVDVVIISTATPAFAVQVLGPFPNLVSTISPACLLEIDPLRPAPDGPIALRDVTITSGPQHFQAGGTDRFPSGVLNNGNAACNYNAVYANWLYGCWNGSSWTTTGISMHMSFTIDIPVI